MARRWCWFLVTGIVWIWFGLMVLQFDLRSVAAIAVLAGVMFFIAGLNEFMTMAVVAGWAMAPCDRGSALHRHRDRGVPGPAGPSSCS